MNKVTLFFTGLLAIVPISARTWAQDHAGHGSQPPPPATGPAHVGHGSQPSSSASDPAASTMPTAPSLPPFDYDFMKPMPPVKPPLNLFLRFDQLEYRAIDDAADAVRWDVQGWYGGDYNRLWLKTEGQQQTSADKAGEGEAQLLYSRLVAPFWDFQLGVRHDRVWGPGPDDGRTFGVIGFQGLAPYWFEIEPALFVSEDGDVSARLTASYDLLITQRLILQPRIDLDAALQDVEEFGVGQGLNDVELGLRLRYEIEREFAPYVGITWTRQLGETADLAREAGGEVEDVAIVFGVRLWF